MQRVVKGFDASQYQGRIDWNAVGRSDYRFAIVKAQDGIPPNAADPNFAENWRGAAAAGLIRGAYCYSRPEPGRNPATEVRYMANLIHSAGGLRGSGDLPLCLDIEWSKGLSVHELEAWVMGWIRTAEQITGKAPIIYTGSWWRDNRITMKLKVKLWLAAYVHDPNGYVPHPSFSRWDFWQETDQGHVPGIAGNVDVDLYRGSERQLRKLATLQRHRKNHDHATGGVQAPPPSKHHRQPRPPHGAPKTLPQRFYKQWERPWNSYGRKFKNWLWDNGYVSPHFTRQEWACHDGTAVPSSLRHNAQRHGANLEVFRHRLGDKPMNGISFFRTAAYNASIGGASHSMHIEGYASDFPKSDVDAIGHHNYFAIANECFSNGGVGEYPWGAAHVDSRGYRARWTSW